MPLKKWMFAGFAALFITGCGADGAVKDVKKSSAEEAEKRRGYPYDFVTVMEDVPHPSRSIDGSLKAYDDELDRICLSGDINACIFIFESKRFDSTRKPEPPSLAMIKLRDHYLDGCKRAVRSDCTALPELLENHFGMKNANRATKEIDDGDRLWWRACLLTPKDSCKIIELHSRRHGHDYEALLRADEAAGGQEGLLERVADYTIEAEEN